MGRAKAVNREKTQSCLSAREFGDIFRLTVAGAGRGWDWERDMRPWMGGVFDGAKFGDQNFMWSPADAEALAREFLSEASTW